MEEILIDPKKKKEMQELVETLASIKGRHTELVTVLVPAEANINIVTRQLEGEKSTASNIKSKTTRKNVIDALETIIRELKNYKQTPPNGLAIFCGNISQREGEQDIKLWMYEPPRKLNVKIYRCDQEFIYQPLKEMLDVTEVFGLLVIDRQAAAIGLLEGNQIKVLQKLTSGVPGKIRAGGQCLDSGTLVETREGMKKIKDLEIGEEIKSLDISKAKIIFTKCINKWKKEKDNYLEIITNNKKEVISSEDHLFFIHAEDRLIEMPAELILKGAPLLNDNLEDEEVTKATKKDKKIELVDIETEERNFFANGLLVHNSSQRFHRVTEGLAKEFFRRVADEMKKIFFDMPKLKGILVGGPIPTKEEFLEEGNLVTKLKEKIISIKDLGYVDEHGLELLVESSAEDIAQQELIKEKRLITKFFETLGKTKNMAVYGEEKVALALERGAVAMLLISKKMKSEKVKEFEQRAESIGSEVYYIGIDHTDGEQFYNLTKGFGAILRFGLE